ncbi:MAG: response regulator transcription factor [Candidatus Dojkabacteria bacterium]
MIKTILIVDDDQTLLKYLKNAFTQLDFKVYLSSDGASAIDKAITKKPDIVLLDMDLPKVSGETVCKELKSMFPEMPIIIMAVRDETSDIVHGFDIGADDYIVKPFEIDELIARVSSRIKVDAPEAYNFADIEIDDLKKKVLVNGKLIKLTPREYILLQYLIVNSERVLSRDLILNKVWTDKEFIEPRVVDVYIGYLRRKLCKKQPYKYIKTIRGFGYRAKA